MADIRRKKPGEGTFGVLLLLLALFLLWQAYGISGLEGLSTPGAFPLAAAAAMVVSALVVVVGDLRRPSEDQPGERGRVFLETITPTVIMIFAGFVIGYAALLDRLGFLPASLLFLFAGIQFLHRRSVGYSFAVALGSLIVIYAVFRLVFQVVLPEGIVPEREVMAWFENLFDGGAE